MKTFNYRGYVVRQNPQGYGFIYLMRGVVYSVTKGTAWECMQLIDQKFNNERVNNEYSKVA